MHGSLREVDKVIMWVEGNHYDCIKFVVNDHTLKSIALYLECNHPDKYITMNMQYGVLFTLAVLEYYKTIEEYERCAVIVESIKLCNTMYKTDLPTSLDSKWVEENRGLKPSEVLTKHFKEQA